MNGQEDWEKTRNGGLDKRLRFRTPPATAGRVRNLEAERHPQRQENARHENFATKFLKVLQNDRDSISMEVLKHLNYEKPVKFLTFKILEGAINPS